VIPALIVPILTGRSTLYEMLATIDYPIKKLIVIDNGAGVDLDSVSRNRCIERAHVITMPANLGVAGSWNLGIKSAPFAPWWLIANYDIAWHAGSLERLAAASGPDRITLSAGIPPWCAFTIGEDVIDKVGGLFDEMLHPAYFEDNDMTRRCEAVDIEVRATDVTVTHANSSTLQSGYQEANARTYKANMDYYAAKREAEDYSAGTWSLARRRAQSWD
jgi:GT2 family glycosyltransferase